MRAPWRDRPPADYLTDALSVLAEWSRDGRQLTRVLAIDDAQHAALTERIKVVADALQQSPNIRRRDGYTRIMLGAGDAGTLSAGTVTLAARIEHAYRTVTGTA